MPTNQQINLNDDGSLWTKLTPDGEPLIIGRQYYNKDDGRFWIYVGDFKSKDDVPNVYCYFTIGECLFKRSTIKVDDMPNKEKVHRKRADDSRPIFTDISDEDNTLMVRAKTVLFEKEITRGDFKEMYDNDSDMNNSLRSVENGGNLSWARFTDIMDKTNVDIEIITRDRSTGKILGTVVPNKAKPLKKKHNK